MRFARRGKVGVAGRQLRRNMNSINNLSFIEEYVDTHYPAMRKQEFESLYDNSLKGGNLWKGKATREGTEMFSLKNVKSRVTRD